MDNNNINTTLLIHYKTQQRIIALQERLISIIRENPNEIQLIEQTETLIDELKGVLK